MHTLDGRRVTITDLVERELLKPGDMLVYDRPRAGVKHTAVVTSANRLRLDDGSEFTTPSRAGVAAAGSPVDGWHAWALEDGRSLDTLRQEVLRRDSDDRTVEGSLSNDDSARRHEFLQRVRREADAGNGATVRVRDLLAHWNARRRGTDVSRRIEADLENYGLLTEPSFRDVTLDASIKFVSIARAAAEEQADQPGTTTTSAAKDAATDAERDGGLKVGNLTSALNGVERVPPTATIDEAVTKMLLNDYSQLAVLSGERELRGAITWRSIAEARHSNPGATFADATTSAREVRISDELIDILPILEENDFVFVRDAHKLITGIVTTVDVVRAYGEMATPFFLLGELDPLLRVIIADNFTLSEVIEACDATGERIRAFDDLTMGDAQQMLGVPQHWERLGWRLDRAEVIKRLDEIRVIRNDVMHFDPDPLPGDAIEKIRNLLKLLRHYSSNSA